jgi:hypothetical protein
MLLNAQLLIRSVCHKLHSRLYGTHQSSTVYGPLGVLIPSYGASKAARRTCIFSDYLEPSADHIRGYGTHADYMFGWKGDALQKAMDKSECFYDGCGSIKKQQMSVANKCTVKDFVGEATDGCKS